MELVVFIAMPFIDLFFINLYIFFLYEVSISVLSSIFKESTPMALLQAFGIELFVHFKID